MAGLRVWNGETPRLYLRNHYRHVRRLQHRQTVFGDSEGVEGRIQATFAPPRSNGTLLASCAAQCNAFELLGQPRRVAMADDCPDWPVPPGYPDPSSEERKAIGVSTWLPVLRTELDDIPRLIALLEHDGGWVRINAAKALASCE